MLVVNAHHHDPNVSRPFSLSVLSIVMFQSKYYFKNYDIGTNYPGMSGTVTIYPMSALRYKNVTFVLGHYL